MSSSPAVGLDTCDLEAILFEIFLGTDLYTDDALDLERIGVET